MMFPKGKTKLQLKALKDRQEGQIKKLVRAAVAVRDGYCRLATALNPLAGYSDHFATVIVAEHLCEGPSQWAHFGDKKRARTRGMKPEVRHTTAGSLMLCQAAHDDYDQGRLHITALTRRGCDGRLKFRRAK